MILICFNNLFSFFSDEKHFIALGIGRDFSLCNFLLFDCNIKIDNFIIYAKEKYFFPEYINETLDDGVAYSIGERLKIERNILEFKGCYGKKIKFGGCIKTEFYKIESYDVKFFENNFSIFTSIDTKYGKIYGEYFDNNNFYLSYFYEFYLIGIINGFKISSFQENYPNIKFNYSISTIKRDLEIGIGYTRGVFTQFASPLEIFLSKRYDNFKISFLFAPSDIIENVYNINVIYYF